MRNLIERDGMLVDNLNYPGSNGIYNSAGIRTCGHNNLMVTYWSKAGSSENKDSRTFRPTETYSQKQRQFKGIRSSI